jgi:lipopolysaccharide/colanic/teichoic acid biosynthesis glycosyltransferase
MINLLKSKYEKIKSEPEKNNFFIYEKIDFKNIIKYERARTDREGNSFSLIFLKDIDNVGLFTKLNKSIKNIDTAAWFTDNCLCIILPATDFDNANELISKIIADSPKTKYKVYTYPDHWITKDDVETDKNLGSINWEKNTRKTKNTETTIDLKEDITSAMVKKIPLWKRFFDISLSLFGIILLLPLFVIVYLFIKIMSPGPVFFKQKRVGYKGKIFDFYKFRTMHINNDQKGHQVYLAQLINSETPMTKLDAKKDSRIIRGGGLLRKTCIDELPQLFNVLKGDMSLVGPRPCLPYEEKEYLHWFRNRFNILPGMTGLWQVSGKNKLTFKQMIRLDIAYVNNLSLLLDIKIVIMTVPTIFNLVFENIINKLKKYFNIDPFAKRYKNS